MLLSSDARDSWFWYSSCAFNVICAPLIDTLGLVVGWRYEVEFTKSGSD